MASWLLFCALTSPYQMATKTMRVPSTMRMSRSRFSFGRFFMLTNLLREKALQCEHHVRIAHIGSRMRRRHLGEQHSVGLLQITLKVGNICNRLFELRRLGAGLRTVVKSVDFQSDPFTGGGRFTRREQ